MAQNGLGTILVVTEITDAGIKRKIRASTVVPARRNGCQQPAGMHGEVLKEAYASNSQQLAMPPMFWTSTLSICWTNGGPNARQLLSGDMVRCSP